MLGAFFGPPYRDWWLSYIKDADFMSPFHNHWLVQKSAARSFAQGFVKLDRLQSSMVEAGCRSHSRPNSREPLVSNPVHAV